MKRHLPGLLVFVLIIAASAIGFSFFRGLSTIESLSDEIVVADSSKYIAIPHPTDPLVVTLESIVYDAATGTFTARLSFSWNRKSVLPTLVTVGIGTTTADRPNRNDRIHQESFKNPFSDGSYVTKEVRWVDQFWGKRELPGAHYAIAELLSPNDDEDGDVKLAIRQYNYLHGSVPVVTKHRDK